MPSAMRASCLALTLLCGSAGAQCPAFALLAPETQVGHRFGSAVVLTATEIWVGAPRFSSGPGADVTGKVYRFDRAGSLLDEFTASDGAQLDQFGHCLAVDGTRVIIGAPGASGGLASSGAAYVFDFDGSGWMETKLTPAVEVFRGGFGEAVALEGDRAAVGQVMTIAAPIMAPGQVAVFDKGPGGWVETTSLSNPETGTVYTGFGSALVLQGPRLIVGDPVSSETFEFLSQGGGPWLLGEKLIAPGNNSFGRCLALDGDLLVVGAPNSLAGGTAFVFRDVAGLWSLETALTSPNTLLPWTFASAVAVQQNEILVGAPGVMVLGKIASTAYLFRDDGGGWKKQEDLAALAPDPNAHFGQAVALDADLVVVGVEEFVGAPAPTGVTLFDDAALDAVDTWDNVWQGLGAPTPPTLAVQGMLCEGASAALLLDSSTLAGFADAWFVLGLSQLQAPFHGGVLVPSPDVVLGPFPHSAQGQILWQLPLSTDTPDGLTATIQAWIPGAATPSGWAASNAIVIQT